ncbi:unnamed protein product [Protopolystoma xenopodis]|uniref:Uncharacterized protein n=1 Tax=Protopolystoma xenopodis TaxID=117903 RepID=A0A448WL27_9PLAT|nr:unnamed protein product [Protopolystoma xenopodis]
MPFDRRTTATTTCPGSPLHTGHVICPLPTQQMLASTHRQLPVPTVDSPRAKRSPLPPRGTQTTLFRPTPLTTRLQSSSSHCAPTPAPLTTSYPVPASIHLSLLFCRTGHLFPVSLLSQA